MSSLHNCGTVFVNISNDCSVVFGEETMVTFSEMKYERPDYDRAIADFKDLIARFKSASSGEEQFKIHQEYYTFTEHLATMQTLAHIRHDIDTTDEFYDAEQSFFDENSPLLSPYFDEYNHALYESKFRPFLEEKIGPVAFKNIELAIRSFTPEMVPLQQEENALVTRYGKLIAGAQIEWEGEILNLSLMTKHCNSLDRDTRIRAWNKTTGFLWENRAELDEIYDRLVKNRTAQARLLGYDTYTRLGYDRMGRNDYGPEEVAAFREEVKKKIVPLATKLHERRRQRIGVDHLYFYDPISFANGDPEPKGTPEEILAEGQKMYSELSPETKEFFDFMSDYGLFDVLGRKTKRSGGYMTTLPDYKAPFVFANFNGTSHDVEVITHECGHAFQGYTVRDAQIREHQNITMETAEIHSMAMEFFTEPWYDRFFGDRAEDYTLMHLEGAITFIPYGCMVDEFQHIVYEHPDMTPNERREAWLKLEKVYRPHMDYGDNAFYCSGGLWQRQQHIFMAPFYYIDYCLAQTVALEYKAWMDRDYKEAWTSYLDLCRRSANDFYSNMIPAVGLKLPFEAGCLDETVAALEEQLGLN